MGSLQWALKEKGLGSALSAGAQAVQSDFEVVHRAAGVTVTTTATATGTVTRE